MRRRLLPVLVALTVSGVATCTGTGTNTGTDTGGNPDTPPEALADVPVDTPADTPTDAVADAPADAPADLPADPGHDLPTLPPLFETGLVIPPDSIPCTAADGTPTNACNHHGSSVAVMPDGTVLAAWYTGLGEYSKDSRIVGSRKAPGQPWTGWTVLFDEPNVPEGNPVIWVDDTTGQLWLFYIRVVGSSWNDGQVMMIRSADGGLAWSQPATLRADLQWMTRNHPLRLSDGEVLLPCYNETLFTPSWLASRDGFTSKWDEITPPDATLVYYLGQIQPSVIERPDGSLFAEMRNGNVSFKGHAIEVTSTDQGRTWSEPVASPIPNPGGAMDMTRLPSGAVMAVFDNSPTDRIPLAVALSDDNGQSWSAVANVVTGCDGGECSYPSLAADPTDGSAWITYTYARHTIGWAHVSEAWIRQKGDHFAPFP